MNFVSANSILYPHCPSSVVSTPSFLASTQIANASEEVSYVFQAPKSGIINKVFFRTGNVTTGCTLDVRLESIDLSTGLPSGSLKSTDSNAAQIILDSDDNKTFLVSLTSGADVVEGDWIAIRLDVLSGAPVGLTIAEFTDAGLFYGPYALENSASILTAAPIFAVEYSDGSYPFILGAWPINDFITASFNNTSTPDVVGNKFKLNYGAKIKGVWAYLDSDGDAFFNLYDTNGATILGSGAAYSNIPPTTAAGIHQILFSTGVPLNSGEYYYLGLEPSTSTNTVVYGVYTDNSGIANALLAPDFTAVSAKDPTGIGSWTENISGAYFMGLIIDGIDIGNTGSGVAPANQESFSVTIY